MSKGKTSAAVARTQVAVLVFGDLGRSPRMQYHALALADAGASVALVGITGEATTDAVREHPAIRIYSIADPIGAPDTARKRRTYVLRAGVRAVLHVLGCLWILLWRVPRIDYLLAQTPPAFPTLPVGCLVARLRGAKLVLDWHNLSHTILALKLGRDHRLVRWTMAVERRFGKRAARHLCVSTRMSKHLRLSWGIDAVPLHDRPNSAFRPATREERVDTLTRLGIVAAAEPGRAGAADGTAVVVTATSWTIDEDMGLLFDAINRLDARIRVYQERTPGVRFPPIHFLISGKGPLRAAFDERLLSHRWYCVTVRTLWLPWSEYASLLGAADLGLSLHRSSSGVDLPMKIVDMFGAGLPVCALDYGPGLDEVIRPGDNGLLFASSGELAHTLFQLFVGFPNEVEELMRLRRGVVVERGIGWRETWQRVAAPIFDL